MHRRTSHAVQGPGPTQQQDQQWSSITLDSASDDFVLPNVAINAHTLGPYDPRTQDPSIAPWALHEEEELHAYSTSSISSTTPGSTNRTLPTKAPSFSIGSAGLFSRQNTAHRPSEALSHGSGPDAPTNVSGNNSKKALRGFSKMLRKASKPNLAKESSFTVPTQPVPSLPSSGSHPTGSQKGIFRKQRDRMPPVPPKDPTLVGDDIVLDTNFETLEGIVDPSRLGTDSRVSFSHDRGSSVNLQGPGDDASDAQKHKSSPLHKYRRLGSHGMTGSTESWPDVHTVSTNGPRAPLPPAFSSSAFTNPFAAPSSSVSNSTNRGRRGSLRLATPSSPTSRSTTLVPESSASPYPNTSDLHKTAISPTDPNDPTSPSWVAPESWAVKRQDVEEDAGSISGDSDNMQLTEPMRLGAVPVPEDDSIGHEGVNGKCTVGRQGSVNVNGGVGVEYKIRVINEVEGIAPYAVFKIPYSETAQSFIRNKFVPKMGIDGEARLWIRDRGRDRMLAGTERILPLLRKRLMTAGYDDDELPNIAGEDLSHIFKLIVRDVGWRADSEEPASIPNPTFIDLTGMSLTKIPILLHRLAQHIVLLNLSKNIGIDLPSDFIQSCEALRELKLAGVGLRRVPPAIRHSHHLARLDISSNRIADLDDSGLELIPSLASLKIQNNRLTNLPLYFASMHGIKDLNVSNNKFDGIPNVLFSMTSLLDLDVSYNNIRVIPPGIGKLVNLQVLRIIGNQLTGFTDECKSLVNLETLDCRRNLIADLSLVSSLPKLNHLHADHNAVHVLDVQFGPCLSNLRASYNQITRLKSLDSPHPIRLMHLDLRYTKISGLDEEVIAGLMSLATLRLDHNHFRTLPASLCKLIYLRHLSCSNNVLDELPNDIGLLENLQILDVHSNSLHQIPASIWQCKNLYLFNATSNLIAIWGSPSNAGQGSTSLPSGPASYGSISEGFLNGSLDSDRRPSQATLIGIRGRRTLPLESSLQKLYLSDNNLRDDSLYFLSRLPQLKVLNISFNDIQDLPSSWLQRLPHLEELYLSGNKLSALPADGLQSLPKLHTLYLNGNRLQTLPAALNKIPTLTVLDVGSNNLRYNINNWHFDWNWNFNRNLKYLNLSGNTRLDIKPEPTKRHALVDRNEPVLHEFNALTQLKVLGLMDVTTGFISSIPDDNEDRRVRTSGSEVNGMGYGIADSMGKLSQLSMFDVVVPSFRMHENECLFGMFGRPEPTHGNTRLSKFVQDRFHSELIIKLNQLRPDMEEGVTQAFRRAFLSMNRELYKFLTNSAFGQFSRKMSIASASSGGAPPGVDTAMLKSGLSAVIIYIVDKMMYVANVGNALAVVSRQGTAYLVSKKHDPLDSNELLRIRATEGWVSQKELLNDELNVSRSFGMYHLLPSVIARPTVTEWDITEQDEFVIIGNCNLWDYVPYQNAVDIARQCRDPMAAAQKLRDMAISYGADGSLMIMVLSVADLFPAKALQKKNALEIGEFGGFKNPLRGNYEPISSKMLNRLPDEVDAPVGHVALVFTDIANSTHLWEKNAGMRTAMAMHNELLRRLLLTIGGYLVKTEGDAFMCSFPTVASALLWCLTAQVSLLKLDWPLEILESQDGREVYDANGVLLARGLSVRMGLHWGAPLCEPDLITHRMDYFGPMVNRSARISGSAKGGQIMISNDVIKELAQHFSLDEKNPPPPPPKTLDPAAASDAAAIRERGHIDGIRRMGFTIIRIGEQKLKGIEAPEALSLILPKQLEGRKNLMHQREDEELSAAVADANSRVPFSIAQMKQLAMLCIRLETLSSGRVFKAAPVRRKTMATLPSMAAIKEEGPIDIVPGVTGIRPPEVVHIAAAQEEVEDSIHLVANPDLLMPSIKEGSTDEYLMLLLDSLSLRIDNALASLYLKQLGGYRPLAAGRSSRMESVVESIAELEGL